MYMALFLSDLVACFKPFIGNEVRDNPGSLSMGNDSPELSEHVDSSGTYEATNDKKVI